MTDSFNVFNKISEQPLVQFIGESKIVKDLRQKICCLAAYDVNVLVTGESGTGKELVARGIHRMSSRAWHPFVPVNCGAIPETLFENEFFGHEKGAFTDAGLKQNGLVTEAEKGTLFLDEVGVISHYVQVKLLRLLQDKEYKPLGGSIQRNADVRVIAATNEDLRESVHKGNFREDLFYRLNIVSIPIPPLRERKEDIPMLVMHFIRKYANRFGKSDCSVSPGVMENFLAYDWPGNIRELENLIQQALIMSADKVITSADITAEVKFPADRLTQSSYRFEDFKKARGDIMSHMEKDYLVRLLTRFNGNVVQAAQGAGRSRTAIWNLLSRHHLHPSQFAGVTEA